MEVLKLSNYEITQEFDQCQHLHELILALENQAQKKGHVVCRVKLNGMDLSESDESRLGETAISAVDEIEIETEDVEDLKKNSISSVVRLIEALRPEVLNLSDVYRGDFYCDARTMSEVRHRFMSVIKSTQTLTEALMILRTFLEEQSTAPDFCERWLQNENHMMATLQELTQGYETEDWPLVADVLEYELSTTLDKWQTLLVGQASVP